jgi:hypothetical protein
VKNRQKTISTEDKIDIISQFEYGKWIVNTCQILESLIVVYVMIMLIELQKVLSQELKCCVARLQQSYQNELYQELWMSLKCFLH